MEIKSEIDKLAEMMQREFGAAQKRFEVMDNKIDGLRSEVGGLRGEVGGLRSEVGGLKNEMGERFDEVLGREDKIFKSLSDLETDNTMGAGASRRQEDELENHEERIVTMEEKLGIDSAV